MEPAPNKINITKIIKRSFIFVLIGFLMTVVVVLFLSRNLPSLEQLENFDPDLVTRIYSVDGKTVVAASPFQSPNIKGTYNSIPIDKVMQKVSQLAFSSAKCANPGDPLFLHFRIKSNRKDVYPPLATAIKTNFAGKLMDARWSFDCLLYTSPSPRDS